MRETSSYEAHSLLSGDDVILSINETKASPFQKKYIALILFILISGAILYGQSEAEIDSISEINYKNVVEDLDIAKLSKTDRKSLLAKLIEEDPELQEIESWGEEFEDAIDDQEIFNEEVLEEEVEDESELSKELMEDSELELAQDLSPEQVAYRFKMRKRIFDEECNLTNNPGPITTENLNFTLSSVTQVFYDEKYKIIMCAAPKAATTNWQKMMAVLKYDGIYDTDHFRKSNVYNQLPRFSQLALDHGEEEGKRLALEKLNDPGYTKFMNARHPFSRLVSAWRDKFPKDRKTGGETYWFRKYGKFISTKFEQDYYEKPEEYYISFPAFADYVAWIGNRARFDHHWKTFNYHCRPCQLRFDFITKAETSSQDSKFIINKANISHIPHIQLPEMYDSSPLHSHQPEDYFIQVSHVTVERLHHAYREDFRLFAYSTSSFEKAAQGKVPEIFTERKRRAISLSDEKYNSYLLRKVFAEHQKNHRLLL